MANSKSKGKQKKTSTKPKNSASGRNRHKKSQSTSENTRTKVKKISPRQGTTDSSSAIVAIGASAGGFNAFKQFFTTMPADSGICFILIQHLAPAHKSLTAELLARCTDMPVIEVVDKMHVKPNHVFVIPPKKYLAINDGELLLTEPIEHHDVRLSIDFFFRSLAEDQKERAIGIIFSGAGTDGTQGVREIKAAGGLIIVQSPDTSQQDGMPRSAIATELVDYVLPVEKMPKTLLRYIQHGYVNGTIEELPPAEDGTDPLKAIIELLRARIKSDFSYYKKGTLIRRIHRRMSVRHIEAMGDYVDLLRQDMDELSALYKDLLIVVTNFFRDPVAWKALERTVISPLVKLHNEDNPIRVWVPGCATGEEAYSIAILFHEQMYKSGRSCLIQIYASDIDRNALNTARAGIYPESIAADIKPERLRRYFIKGSHTYRINKEIRDTVTFAEQNVISDPPFSRIDLISCRNLLIYLETEAQKRIMGLFHFALREGGYLFLGNSETTLQYKDMFKGLSHKYRISRRIGPTRHGQVEIPTGRNLSPPASPAPMSEHSGVAGMKRGYVSALAQQLLINRFVPVCVLIDRQASVLYLNGPVDDYLLVPDGEPVRDLLAMARNGLRPRLRSAIYRAIRENSIVTGKARIKRGSTSREIRLQIEPLQNPREAKGLLMVLFDELTTAAEQQARPAELEMEDTSDTNDTTICNLEDELRITRNDLHASMAEFETSTEELKAANEEISSINEELQVNNEELETSKEELQSMNEELQTVNNQLEIKLNELESANDDLANLFDNTEIPIIFLDRHFHLKRFTPATNRLMQLRETDLGRSITDFAWRFTDDSLLDDAKKVLKQLTPINNYIQDDDKHWYSRQITPYLRENERIDGVVITFTDITKQIYDTEALAELNQELEKHIIERTRELTISEQRLSMVLETTHEIVWDWDIINDTIWENRPLDDGQYYKQLNAPTTSRHAWFDRIYTLDRGRVLNSLYEALDSDAKQWQTEYRLALTKDSYEWFADQALILRDETGKAIRMVGAMRNIMDQKLLEQEIAHVSEEERRRFGRELHDTFSQQLFAMGVLAETVKGGAKADPTLATNIEKLVNAIETTKQQFGRLLQGFFPYGVDAAGFQEAIKALTEETNTIYNVSCRYEYSKTFTVDEFCAPQLYLIAREAVHNAAKHSGASEIVLYLDGGEKQSLQVIDNGRIGINKKSERHTGRGLRIMQHRCSIIGGDLNIDSENGTGTVVMCTFQSSNADV